MYRTFFVLELLSPKMFIWTDSGDRADVQNVVVHLTDGVSMDKSKTWRESVALREAGAHILVIAIGTDVSIPKNFIVG